MSILFSFPGYESSTLLVFPLGLTEFDWESIPKLCSSGLLGVMSGCATKFLACSTVISRLLLLLCFPDIELFSFALLPEIWWGFGEFLCEWAVDWEERECDVVVFFETRWLVFKLGLEADPPIAFTLFSFGFCDAFPYCVLIFHPLLWLTELLLGRLLGCLDVLLLRSCDLFLFSSLASSTNLYHPLWKQLLSRNHSRWASAFFYIRQLVHNY